MSKKKNIDILKKKCVTFYIYESNRNLMFFLSLLFYRVIKKTPQPTPLPKTKPKEEKNIEITNSNFVDINQNPIYLFSKNTPNRYLNETTILTGLIFQKCTGFFGGAIYVSSNIFLISNCFFTQNIASQGSSIYLVGSTFYQINYTSHFKNTAKNIAPALFLDSNPESNSDFLMKNNFTSLDSAVGSCVVQCGANPTTKDCIFDKLSSESCGALMIQMSPYHSDSFLLDSTFTNCSSLEKGAAITMLSYNSHILVSQCFLRGCKCLNNVGDLFYTEEKKCTATFLSCDLFGNRERFFGNPKLSNLANISLCRVY